MKQLLSFLIAVMAISFSSGQVTFYTACSYRGNSMNLGPGNYYNAAQYALPDKSINAIKIPMGYRVEVYTGINMGGKQFVYTSDKSCLPSGVGNSIRSVRITYNNDMPGENVNPYGGVSVFTECGYHGRNAYLPPGNYAKLKSVIGNDAISSMRVPEGMVIELYKDDNFKGTSSGKITADNACLGNYWNNTASSAKISYNTGGWIPPTVTPPISNNGAITIYYGCNYYGKSTHFDQGDYTNLKSSLSNQPAGSVMIPAGLTVEFYSQPNYGGYLMGKFTSNKPRLKSDIQYGAGSMRVYQSGGTSGGSGSDGVSIYSSCNFSGKSFKLTEGSYNNLNSAGIFSPASIMIPAGYEITLYQGTNMQGTSTGKISSDSKCLGSWIQGKAMSAIVSRKNPTGVPREKQ
jgi:hypothetical protein